MNAETMAKIPHRDCQVPSARELIEASVHLPHRGKRWIASFRNEQGRQQWKSTGLTNRRAALVLAKEWEAAAQRRRGAESRPPRRSLIPRTRRGGENPGFTQQEVAMMMKISERAVRSIERRALEKLGRNPVLMALWREWNRGQIEEKSVRQSDWELSAEEIAAVYNLAQTPAEREVIRKVLAVNGGTPEPR